MTSRAQSVEISAENQFGPTLAERLVRRIRPALDYPDMTTWDDWLHIVSTIFVEEVVADKLIPILAGGRAGELGLGPEGRFVAWAPPAIPEHFDDGKPNPAFDPAETYSCIEYGDPPAAVPGLTDYLVVETHRQLRLRIAQEKDPLTRMGLSQIAAPEEKLSFRILQRGVFLFETRPGGTVIVVGDSGVGKTTLVVGEFIEPALDLGYRVVSNIFIENPPPGYTYVTTMSEYLTAIFRNALEGFTTIAVRDEGGLGRMKQSAMSEGNREFKMLTMILRKPKCIEVTIYQLAGDVPAELRAFCTHYIKIVAQGKAFVMTPIEGLERRMVVGLPSDEAREKAGRRVLKWDTSDIAPLVRNIKIELLFGILRRLPKRRSDPKAQFRMMIDYIDRVTGVEELQFTEDDVIKMIAEVHYNKPEWGWRTIDQVIVRAREAIGRGHYWTYQTTSSLGIVHHKINKSTLFCEWCRKHRIGEDTEFA